MSAATAPAVHRLPQGLNARPRDPAAFRILSSVLTSAVVIALAGGLLLESPSRSLLGQALVWTCLVAVVDLAPFPQTKGLRLGMDLPLLLAASFVFGPALGGLIAFVGAADRREFRRETTPLRALFNRSQTALSVMSAGLVFRVSGIPVEQFPLVALPAAGSLLADSAVNYALVSAASSILTRTAWSSVVRRMRLGKPWHFAWSYAALGLLGLLLAQIYVALGVWALGAFVVPIVLAHQAFLQTGRAERQAEVLQAREAAMQRLSSRIADERHDERSRIASSLHDDVLQSLYNVTLYAQVIREDLRSGRLLQLDEDVPGLLQASETASGALRDVIRDLRRSPLGRAGLEDTLELFVQHLADESGVRIDASIEDVEADSDTQLLIYQVAKEALINAVRHSSASRVAVTLSNENDSTCLVVSDNGAGFVVDLVDSTNHFGLALMHDRVNLCGGVLDVESTLGSGTVVTCRFPIRS